MWQSDQLELAHAPIDAGACIAVRLCGFGTPKAHMLVSPSNVGQICNVNITI